MAAEKLKLRVEIGHVLFLDVVGYSKLLIEEQTEVVQELTDLVRNTESAREAEAAEQLVRLPAGDGMALVFTSSAEAPVECALELSRALRAKPHLPLRMGIHSGPVQQVEDVNARANIAGAGINMAQRVMDCGDAGHILLSKRVADDLAHSRQWQPFLHDLGDCEVKHGVVVSLVNVYGDDFGNPAIPTKVANCSRATRRIAGLRAPQLIIGLLLLLGLLLGGFILFRRSSNPRAAAPAAEKSVAVLPFDNLSRDPENAFFTDGVQDEILTDLARIADLKVISRTSVMQYRTGGARNLREIGQQLGVAHLLEGSVQRANNRVRVNAQLIDARTDAHLWAESYDGDLADVFGIQSKIAKAIADQLQAKLSPNEKNAIEQRPTNDVAAFELYSRARNLIFTTSFSAISGQNLLAAADYLNQALALDPGFFAAQCQLASVHDQLYFLSHDHTPARLALAQAAVDAAFRLRPDAGEAHLARAEHLYRGYLDYDGALAELAVARQTLPNDPRVALLTGAIARRQGKQEEGLRDLERAVELDPRNFFTLQQISISYLYLRRYAEAVAVLDRALSIKPDDVETKVARALVWLNWKAEPVPLRQTLDEIRATNPDAIKTVADAAFLCALAQRDPAAAESALKVAGESAYIRAGVKLRRSVGEGLLARMLHDDARAQTAFLAARTEHEQRMQDQQDYAPAICVLGLIDAGLGRKEDALREGRRAMELLPVSKDSINGPLMIEFFAIIAGWLGEKDLAFEHLTTATQLPGELSYGNLKLLPFWDPLRDDPRFEKIVRSLKPRD